MWHLGSGASTGGMPGSGAGARLRRLPVASGTPFRELPGGGGGTGGAAGQA